MSLHPNEEPSQSNGIFMDLILSICGLATSLLTAVLLWVIESKLEFRAHSFMILFILPVGALISGFIAASGYYLGARLFHCRPTAMLTLGVLAVSVGTYFAIHYFSFRSLEIEGTPLSDYISFGSFLDAEIRATSLQFRNHGRDAGGTGALGVWGYGFALLQIVGFAVGGFTVIGILSNIPYCGKCSRYFTAKGNQTRYFNGSALDLQALVKKVFEDFKAGQLTAALESQGALGNPRAAKTDTYYSVIEVRSCRECSQHLGKFHVYRKSGNEWGEIADLRAECRTDEVVDV